MQYAIQISNLQKTYSDEKSALNQLSFSVKKGEIFSLLGPNGAGKSTLINILTTFLQPTGGEVIIFEYDLKRSNKEIREIISCVSQKNSIDGFLTLFDNMKFQGQMYGINGKKLYERIEDLTTTFDLRDYLDKKVSDCSGGVQRRLDIAMSMMSIPQILFLDEPTTGMDIESRKAMWEQIKILNKKYGTTVFLTTHYLEEAEILSDRICIMKDGKEQILGTPSELKKYLKQNLIRVCFNDRDSKLLNSIKRDLVQLDYINSVHIEEGKMTINVENTEKNFKKIIEKCLYHGISFYNAEIVEPTLNDVFLTISHEEVSKWKLGI